MLNSLGPMPITGAAMSPTPFVSAWPISPLVTGNLGKLKKSKVSKYSSSFGAGVLAGVMLGIRDTIPTCFGCLDIKKSRSYAHRLISANIFTEDGVIRSPAGPTDRSESLCSSRTRWSMAVYLSATSQKRPISRRLSTKNCIFGLNLWSTVEPWTNNNLAATQRVKAKGGPSFGNMPVWSTNSPRATIFSTASRQRWPAP